MKFRLLLLSSGIIFFANSLLSKAAVELFTRGSSLNLNYSAPSINSYAYVLFLKAMSEFG